MSTFNADLVDDLARQKVVLFVGAGVSASATTRAGGRIKGWESFLRDMCLKVDTELAQQAEEFISKKDFLLACEILQAALSDEWEKLVSDEFGQMAEPSPLHKALISLDQRIILTTNFDKILDVCWISKEGSSTHLPRVINKVDSSIFKILKDHSGMYLLKIHGTVDSPDTLIFSRSEYIRLAFGNSLYSVFLEMLLLNYTFLFVGFSMDDPAICSLMELYALRYEKARPHYLFAGSDIPQNLIDINRRLRKLQIIQYDGSNNHEKLPGVISSLSEQVYLRRREMLAALASK